MAVVALPRFALMFHSNTVARNLLMKPEVKQRKPDYFRVMLSGAFSQLLGKFYRNTRGKSLLESWVTTFFPD